jgi:hypothetical protein
MRVASLLAWLLLGGSACRVAGGDAPAPVHPCEHAGSLAASLEPLARWFDEGAGRTRFMSLLSPT